MHQGRLGVGVIGRFKEEVAEGRHMRQRVHDTVDVVRLLQVVHADEARQVAHAEDVAREGRIVVELGVWSYQSQKHGNVSRHK